MASLEIARADERLTRALSPARVAAGACAPDKLIRLLELRAVIDTLRCEREARDPQLAWVTGRETAGH